MRSWSSKTDEAPAALSFSIRPVDLTRGWHGPREECRLMKRVADSEQTETPGIADPSGRDATFVMRKGRQVPAARFLDGTVNA
jgi:hypothetical protein